MERSDIHLSDFARVTGFAKCSTDSAAYPAFLHEMALPTFKHTRS